MEINFTDKAVADLKFWKKSGDKPVQKRIELLLASILSTPFEGYGKPEALKHGLSGKWSRRIDDEHRIVYEVRGGEVVVLSLRGHY